MQLKVLSLPALPAFDQEFSVSGYMRTLQVTCDANAGNYSVEVLVDPTLDNFQVIRVQTVPVDVEFTVPSGVPTEFVGSCVVAGQNAYVFVSVLTQSSEAPTPTK